MKGLRYVVAAVVGLAAIFSVNEANAFGKGEMSVGLTGGFASYNESGYVSMNYQWECADHVRIAPEIGYIMGNDHKSGFMINGDVHFPFLWPVSRSTTGIITKTTTRRPTAAVWESMSDWVSTCTSPISSRCRYRAVTASCRRPAAYSWDSASAMSFSNC